MRREIKFRAWDSEKAMMYAMHIDGEHTGKFVYTPPIKGMIFIKNWDATIFEPSNFHAMQFTGLLDKNGKEIYEGDVVKWGDEGSSSQASVKWSESNWSYTPFRKNKFTKKKREFEIIGNIYENPELLKV